jgi:hypothetical protein
MHIRLCVARNLVAKFVYERVCVQVYDTPVKDWKTQYNDACGRQAGGVAADEDDDMS